MGTTGVGRTGHLELSGGISAEHIGRQLAIGDKGLVAGLQTIAIKRDQNPYHLSAGGAHRY